MPIQRHDALRSLSRDHHVALQLARGLQSGAAPLLRAQLPQGARACAAHVRRVFVHELEAHFAAEERVLLPAIAGRDETLDRIWADIDREHAEMRGLITKLEDESLDDGQIDALLDRFGHLLEEHVRKEERSLYQRVQEVLDERTLEAVGEGLERHLSVRRPVPPAP